MNNHSSENPSQDTDQAMPAPNGICIRLQCRSSPILSVGRTKEKLFIAVQEGDTMEGCIEKLEDFFPLSPKTTDDGGRLSIKKSISRLYRNSSHSLMLDGCQVKENHFPSYQKSAAYNFLFSHHPLPQSIQGSL